MSAQTSRRGRRAQRTPGNRFATALRRLRWPVAIVWLILIVALDPLSSSLSKATNDTASAYLPSSAASTKVPLLQEAQLVACRPLVTAIIVVLLLGTACAGLASLRIDNNPTDNVRATRAAWWASD